MRTRKRNRSKKNKTKNRRTRRGGANRGLGVYAKFGVGRPKMKPRTPMKKSSPTLTPLQLPQSSTGEELPPELMRRQSSAIFAATPITSRTHGSQMYSENPDAEKPHLIPDSPISEERVPGLDRSYSTEKRTREARPTECVPMTGRAAWPKNEGCLGQKSLYTLNNVKYMHLDRFGDFNGGFCGGITVLSDNFGFNGSITSYMKRGLKTFAPFKVCVEQYQDKMLSGAFIYNQFIINEKYNASRYGNIHMLHCTSGPTFWLNEMVKKGTFSHEEMIKFFTGANQCTFLVPKDKEIEIFKHFYGDKGDEAAYLDAIVSDYPQRLLLQYPWTRKIQDGRVVDVGNCVPHMTRHEEVDYYTFTIQGLIEIGMITVVQMPLPPPFIDEMIVLPDGREVYGYDLLL